MLLSDPQFPTLLQQYEKDPDSVQDRLDLMVLSQYYFLHKQFNTAETIGRRVLKINPQDPKSYQLMGIFFAAEHRYDNAAQNFQKQFDLGDPEGLHWIYYTWHSATNWAAIAPLIPQMLQNKDKMPQIIDDLVEYALHQKPPDQKLFFHAIDGLTDEQLTATHRDYIHYYTYGLALFGQKDRAQSIQALAEKSIELEEFKKIETAMTFNHSQAVAAMNRFESTPMNGQPINLSIPTLLAIATVYFNEKQYDKARALFGKIYPARSNDVFAVVGVAKCDLVFSNFDAAITEYRHAWALGARDILRPMAVAYLASTNDLRQMSDLIPLLLKDKSQYRDILLAYTVKVQPFDKNLFVETVDAISDEELLENKSVASLAIMGFDQLGQKDHAERLRNKLQASPK